MTWRRSSACDTNHCAEVRHLGDRVQVRSTLRPDVVVVLDLDEWRALVEGVRRGDFDEPWFRPLAEIQASVRR